MDGTIAVCRSQGGLPLPQLDKARDLFALHLPCELPELRRVYLRLALQYHPDKRPEAERTAATQLFQAIAAVYEELRQADTSGGDFGAPAPRVKSRVAAAAELGDLEELRRLLEELPSRANEEDDLGIVPLMFAAAGGCIAAADMLLEFGADVHARNPIGWSVLVYAALANNAAMVHFLVERGAKVSDNDLILTAFTGNPAGLQPLCKHYSGSVGDMRTDQSKKSLLYLAVEGMCFLKHSAEQHAACVDICLKHGVPVDAREPKHGRTCLQDYVADVRWKTRAFENSRAHMEVLEQLCMYGANVTAEDNAGQSALSIASDMGLDRVRQALFAYT